MIAVIAFFLIAGNAKAQDYTERQVAALCWHNGPGDNPGWTPDWLEMKIYHDMPQWAYLADEFRLTHSHASFYMVRRGVPDEFGWYEYVYGELEENYKLRPGWRRLVWKKSWFIHTQWGGMLYPNVEYGMNQSWIRDWRDDFMPPKVSALKGGGNVDPDYYETGIPIGHGLRQSRGPCTNRDYLRQRTYAAPVWTPKARRLPAYPGQGYPGPAYP
jgi:hypothetical protein